MNERGGGVSPTPSDESGAQAVAPSFRKRRQQKADGRYVIYYEFPARSVPETNAAEPRSKAERGQGDV